MSQPVPAHNLDTILSELEAALAEERAALSVLDRDAIAAIAERKLLLDAELRRVAETSPPQKDDLERLRRLRSIALANQLLLVHARSCIKGMLSLLSREQIPQRPGLEANTAPPPVAVNFRW